MNIQRLRNLTTGILHTTMSDVYADIEWLVGVKGIMTHMLPSACRALEPWLRQKLSDQRLFDSQYDPLHVGDTPINPMDSYEQGEFWKRYGT